MVQFEKNQTRDIKMVPFVKRATFAVQKSYHLRKVQKWGMKMVPFEKKAKMWVENNTI